MKTLLTLILIITISITSLAQISTDRPSISDSSTIMDMGAIQIESGIIYQNSEYSYFQSTRLNLMDNTEIRFGFNENVFREGNNLFLIGLKTIIYSNPNSFFKNISILLEGNVSDLDNYVITKVISDLEIFPTWDITTNIGYLRTSLGNSYPYSMVISPRFDSKWTCYGEIYGNDQIVPSIAWNAGLLYRITNNIQLDVSSGKTFSGSGQYSSFGLSLNI